MATDFPTTQRRKQNWFQAHDWQLGLIIAATATLFLVLLVPLIGTLSFMNSYHEFIQDVSESARYGREHGTTTITLDGEPQKVSFDGVSEVIGNLTDAGMGRPTKAQADGGILIGFGDGTSLSLSRISIDTTSRLSDTGVLVRYTRADGSVYAYDSDRLGYEALCDYLHLRS